MRVQYLFFFMMLMNHPQGFAATRAAAQQGEAFEECMMCHEVEVRTYKMTAHGNNQVACAACHGDPRRHREDTKGQGALVKPSELTPTKSQALCLECHKEKGKDVEERFSAVSSGHENLHCFDCHLAHLRRGAYREEEYQFKESSQVDCAHCHKNIISEIEHAPHGKANMNCAACHRIHEIKNVSESIENEIGRCLKCHPGQELEFQSPYRHPLRERQITCASCHDPHSERYGKMLRKETDQMCGDCHGDILIEGGRHPVSKNTNHSFGAVHCTDCHHPHGSNYEAVLVQPSEELCHTCHH